MKKIVTILTAVILIAVIFAGCKANPENNNNPSSVANKGKASDMDCFITYDNIHIEALSDKGNKQKSLVIPENFISASSTTFKYNENIINVEFENPDFQLSQNAFYGCSNLENIKIPNNAVEIPKLCFCECLSLTSITMPDTVTSIGERAFSRCENLNNVAFGKGIQNIEESAFSYTAITEVNLPSSVKTIGEDAFRYCDSLISVVLNNGTETLGRFAFADCHKLESVVLPESISSIDDSFAHTGLVGEEYVDLKISVVKGSWADIHFDEFASSLWNAGEMTSAEKVFK